MKINPSPAPVQLSIIITPSATDAEKLIVGQRLTATVTKVLEQGMATLAVRNMVFIARTALPLKAGQVLNLVVAENKPDLVMRVIKGEVETPVFPRALRYAVTNQRTHAELLANLKYIAGKPLDVAAHLPSAVVRFVRQAVLNLPDMRQLSSSEGMKTALFNAGVFLERKLLQQLAGNKEDMSLRQDFKAALLRLRGALSTVPGHSAGSSAYHPTGDPRPPRMLHAQPRTPATLSFESRTEEMTRELLRQVEGALARVQLHQLTSLIEQERGNAVWNMELPLRDEKEVGVIQLRIEREKTDKPSGDSSIPTVATFAVNFDSLGAIYARVTLLRKDISVVLWGERETTVALVSEHIDDLRDRLQDAGLTTTTLACYQGHLPGDRNNEYGMSLLDLRV